MAGTLQQLTSIIAGPLPTHTLSTDLHLCWRKLKCPEETHNFRQFINLLFLHVKIEDHLYCKTSSQVTVGGQDK